MALMHNRNYTYAEKQWFLKKICLNRKPKQQ